MRLDTEAGPPDPASAERILADAPDGIVLLDRDFGPVCWNRAAERMFGADPASGLGSHRPLLAARDELYRSAREALQTGFPRERVTIDRPAADGGTTTLSVTITVLRDASGAVEGYIACYRDATHLRRRTQQLRMLSSLVAALATKSSHDGVIEMALKGACELTESDSAVFVEVRETECEILAVVGAPAFVAGYRYPTGVGRAAETVRKREPITIDFTEDTSDDALVRSLGFTRLLDVPLPEIAGRHPAILCVARRDPAPYSEDDIAVLESMAGHAAVALQRAAAWREELKLREELEEASLLKDKFLATVSHELRTPLTAVSGFLKVLRSQGSLDSDFAAELILRADAQADRLGRLIDRLLDAARSTSGAGTPPSAVDLRRTVAEAVDGTPRGRVIVGPVPEVTIVGNDDDLQSVVRNLVDNGLKYAGGTAVRVSGVQDGDWVEVVVEDDGPAVAEQDVARLFERFYRGASSGPAPGMGVGLSIVKEFTERMGGSVRYEPAGRGARFVVRLPVAFRAGTAAPA